MKITRTSKEYKTKIQLKEEALRGCDVCPCCGSKNVHRYDVDCLYGIKKNDGTISQLLFLIPKINKWYVVEKFLCKDCGAEWQSDPYEYVEVRLLGTYLQIKLI